MPDIIHLLPDKIANRIAAGEVVQRPASVVKELLENAVDAGADRVELHLRQAGKTMIQVIDNGKGMTDTDARMSFERHATSKIRHVQDLEAIQTMGFRGEALASIASVARVELQTKTAEASSGIRIVVEGSELLTNEPVACLTGTTMTVKNIFFNTPARRKFLKSDPVELKHIHDEFLRVALAYPEIYFSLTHNDNETYRLPPSPLKGRIINALGKGFEDKLHPINEDTDVVQISGYVGSPASAKKRRGQQYFFVNKRFIKSPYLHHAIRSAYEGLIQSDVHPFYLIFLDLDPTRVDVNVHPTKQEVKFEDNRILYNYLKVSTRHALAGANAIPSLEFERPATGGFDPLVSSREGSTFKGGLSSKSAGESSSSSSWSSSGSSFNPDVRRQSREGLEKWSELYKGTEPAADLPAVPKPATEDTPISIRDQNLPHFVLKNRIVCIATADGLTMIDRQAAETAFFYDSFLDGEEIPKQRILFPLTIHRSPADKEYMDSILPVVNGFGFELEEFGDDSYLNHSEPALEGFAFDLEELINQLIDDLKSDRPTKNNLKEYLAQHIARRIAQKRRKSMNSDQVYALYQKIVSRGLLTSPAVQGKILIHQSIQEVLKQFKS